MKSVTVRDLRNKGGDILDRVARGERVIVTRDGRFDRRHRHRL
jgi:prevent-host-death family protein